MSSSSRKISIPNKIGILLLFLLLFLPEKSAFAEEVISVIPNGIVITDTITEEKKIIVYQDIILPETTGFKSYMSYKALNPNSVQGLLQKYCHTDENGFRRFDDKYVVAVGTGANARIGDFIDIYLENNVVIHAVVGDTKSPQHTDKTNLVSINGCCTEFLVDTSQLNKTVKTSGDASFLSDDWNCSVAMFRVYKIH